MQLLEAILNRRTIKEFTTQNVPDELLNAALEAGLWAQNHRLTQPWRFGTVGLQTRARIAASFSLIVSKPAVVAVWCLKSDGAEQEREDYAAVACAIQNIQLRAWDLGLGMQWSSGQMATSPLTQEILGTDGARETLVGLLFFGFPAKIPAPAPRKSLDEVVRRLP